MKLYIGADHNGFEYKQAITDLLRKLGYEVVDESNLTRNPEDDFPQFAGKVVADLKADGDSASRGILICGSGQGMCMAANRFKGIRASLVWNIDEARSSRNDDDSNVLCLSASYTKLIDAEHIITVWLSTPFAGAPRFKRRLQQLDELA